MSKAIELIVDGYVRLNDRKALDDLRGQRRRLADNLAEACAGLADDLKGRTGFDFDKTIEQLQDEIVAIEAGLARLDETARPAP